MDNKIVPVLGCLLLAACAPVADKYKDTRQLEIPPTLAVEHVANSLQACNSGASSEASDLDRLIMIVGGETKPWLQFKAGFDRTWDLVDKAITKSEIEVVDKNHDDGTIRVKYVADKQVQKGKSIFALFSSDAEAEYIVRVDKDKRTTMVNVDKAPNAEQAQDKSEADNVDDSAVLVRLLHQTIIASLEK